MSIIYVMCKPSPPVLRSFFVSLIEEPLLLIQLPLTAQWLLQPPLSQTISDNPKKKRKTVMLLRSIGMNQQTNGLNGLTKMLNIGRNGYHCYQGVPLLLALVLLFPRPSHPLFLWRPSVQPTVINMSPFISQRNNQQNACSL